jgi:putative ABC transport system permease protein
MRAYRALLHLYPASFRGEYGEEMAAIFRQRLREAGGIGPRVALWCEAVLETLANALAVHWDILRQDLRYTARTLSRSRGFALTAIVIVALGIGANTAAFSITDFVLFRPLPFAEPDRLVTVMQRTPGYARMELSPANYLDWKNAATSFEHFAAYKGWGATITGYGDPEPVTGAAVTADLFTTLGVSAALGRAFGPGDDAERAPRTILLSDALWRSHFGGDAGVLGRKLTLEGQTYEVIGVMPPTFGFPSRQTEVWVPFVIRPADLEDRTNNEDYGIARLKPGVTLESARSEMEVIAARLRQQYPRENENTGASVNALQADLSRQSRAMVLALSGAAFAVLLIVCANLANLLLARALGRRQELAVRAAMGAGRERLIRQLGTESMVVAALGGGLGVLLAAAVVPALWRFVPASLPTPETPSVDLRVLAFAAALTLVTAAVFGLAPMLRRGAHDDMAGLREGARAIGGRKERLRGALVVGEVTASVVLLVVTGLLVRALVNVRATDPGFVAEGVLTVQTAIPATYSVTQRRADLYARILDRVRALPGVQSAAYVGGLPMVRRGGIWPVGIGGPVVERVADNSASMRFTTPGFFAVMRIPILSGRDVSDTDTAKSEFVAVVSQSFGERYWPGESALGRRFHFAGKERTVVGIVRDIRVRGLDRSSEPQVYLPHRQVDDGWYWGYTPNVLVVRADTALEPIVAAVRSIVRDVDPQLPLAEIRPMTDVVDAETASRALQVRVLGGFAFVAFLLAAIGIHGVLAFAVSQRTAEIGVRIALGAQRGDILSMIVRQGALLVAAGLVPALLLAYVAGQSLQSVLFGVTPGDVPTFAAAIALTAVMALAGTLLPAIRAVRIDPILAIRSE